MLCSRSSERFKSGLQLAGWMLALSSLSLAQAPGQPTQEPAAVTEAVRSLQQEVQLLRAAVEEVRSQAAAAREETQELRQALEHTQAELRQERGAPAPAAAVLPTSLATPEAEAAAPEADVSSAGSVEARLAKLWEQFQFLTSVVDEQHQTKIESASKYRMRLSGIVLLSVFSNRGLSDNLDIPTYALQRSPGDPAGSFGASLRQSQIGLEVFGPRLLGARTSGDVQLDFAGGFPNTANGANSGLVRLRTGTFRVDWERTSIVAGQDQLFFSPRAPTSFASLAVPALSYAGNLWSWTPQVRVERRLWSSEASEVKVQAGILDNLTGEPPLYSSYRAAQAGEQSRQPAYATRIGWQHRAGERLWSIGSGGYYSRQNYGYNRKQDGWAGTLDWDLSLARKWALSGAFYRGRAIGGIGGGLGRSVIFSDYPNLPSAKVRGLNAIGGWSQLKYQFSPTLEFNLAFGQDSTFAKDLRAFQNPMAYFDPNLNRNLGSFTNFIYRPRSNLLFSGEYRYFRSSYLTYAAQTTGQLNLSMGILF